MPLIERCLLVTTCVARAGCSIAEGLVRSDRVVDDAESVDLHLQGVQPAIHRHTLLGCRTGPVPRASRTYTGSPWRCRT
jgi:hypothetical protein